MVSPSIVAAANNWVRRRAGSNLKTRAPIPFSIPFSIPARCVLLYVKRWLTAPVQRPDGTQISRDRGSPQGSLCSAEHNPPYAQRRVMRSAGVSVLVGAGSVVERCA